MRRRRWTGGRILTELTAPARSPAVSIGWTNVHIGIDIAIDAYSANLARGLTVTKGILAANIAAGLLTMAMSRLTLMTPHFPFVAALVLLIKSFFHDR